MNRIILIGNGFDLAHGLETGYRNFIDWYWTELKIKINGDHARDSNSYQDDFVEWGEYQQPENSPLPGPIKRISMTRSVGKDYLIGCLDHRVDIEENQNAMQLVCKNHFFKIISEKTYLQNWLDIENEYYSELKSYLNLKTKPRNEAVKKLNKEFNEVKKLLAKYLIKVCRKEVAKIKLIEKYFASSIGFKDIAISKRELVFKYIEDLETLNNTIDDQKRRLYAGRNGEVLDKLMRSSKYKYPEKTLILNFNYTDTAEKLYTRKGYSVIDIHGKLNHPSKNPIIFGYGDEMDDDYREIEKRNDNDFLENIKSIRYLYTPNYRELLSFLEKGPYQVFIMGHSCGNSDRTLLNTLFEHENCISIKPFLYQKKYKKKGITTETKDNYMDTVANISRSFNDKPRMRDIVVNRTSCRPFSCDIIEEDTSTTAV